MIISEKVQERNKVFQKSPEFDALKVKREENVVQLRKKKRIEHANKKRVNLNIEDSSSISFQFDIEMVPSALLENYPTLHRNMSHKQRLVMLKVILTQSPNSQILSQSVQCLKKIIQKNKTFPYEIVFDDDLVNIFMHLLTNSNEDLNIHVLWCLIDAFHENSKIIEKFVRKGIIQALNHLLCTSNNREILENSLWCLGNLLGEGKYIREIAIGIEIWNILIKFTKTTDISLRRITFWVLSNLCNGKNPAIHLGVALEILQTVHIGLLSEDLETISEAAWVIFYLTEVHSEAIDSLFASNLFSNIFPQIHNPDTKIQYPILKIFGNISAGPEIYCEKIVSLGFLHTISPLLTHPHKSIKKEVLFIFSNFLAGNYEMVLLILNSPCIFSIIEYMKSDVFEIKKEAVWGICNAGCAHDIRIVQKLIELKVIPLMIESLCHNHVEFVQVILDAFHNIFIMLKDFDPNCLQYFFTVFDEMKGFIKLEKLLQHSNAKINQKAQEIIEMYSQIDNSFTSQSFESPTIFSFT